MKVWSWLVKGANDLAAVSLGLIGVLVCIDVFLRTALDSPIKGAYAYVELVLVAVLFLPLALVQQQGRQVKVELLSDRVKGRPANLLAVLFSLAVLAFFGAILWRGGLDWLWSLRMHEVGGEVKVPMAVPRGWLVLGAALVCGESLRNLLVNVRLLFCRRR